ncbi:hypothetical protein N9230_03465 [Akkermansiaceae bacterium]|nr:hypothetical protein [Akkermansiaceae bacterium]
MNIKRPLPKTLLLAQQRQIFVSRNLPPQPSEVTGKISRVEKISQTLASCFAKEEDQGPRLTDEIPGDLVRFLVGESSALLSSPDLTPAHWEALSQFLAKEMGEFIALKNQMNDAQRDCEDLLKIAEEVCDPVNEVSPNRVLEVAVSLQEAKMRRTNLRARVKLVIDELSAEILDQLVLGDRDSAEIRLRGVLGKLS